MPHSRLLPIRSHRARLIAAAAAVVVGALSLSGCNIVGPVAYFIHGPEKIPAEYTIPEGSSVVVFIDDRRSVLPDRSLRKRIAAETEKTILADKQEVDLIASDTIIELASRDRFNRPKGIVEMGEAVGAKFVIYATIDAFVLAPDGQTMQPTARVRMKVVDVAGKSRAWPAEPDEWKVLTVGDKPRTDSVPRGSTEQLRAQQALAERLGRSIGQVFVKHEQDRDSRVGDAAP